MYISLKNWMYLWRPALWRLWYLMPLWTIFQLYRSWHSVLLVKETGVPGENHWPATSHWQTLSHNVFFVFFVLVANFSSEVNQSMGRKQSFLCKSNNFYNSLTPYNGHKSGGLSVLKISNLFWALAENLTTTNIKICFKNQYFNFENKWKRM
jgi:hypothetical protein